MKIFIIVENQRTKDGEERQFSTDKAFTDFDAACDYARQLLRDHTKNYDEIDFRTWERKPIIDKIFKWEIGVNIERHAVQCDHFVTDAFMSIREVELV